MADAIKDVQKQFDKLVKDIVGHINRIITKLKGDKGNSIQMYKTMVEEYHVSIKQKRANEKAAADGLVQERQAQIPDDKKAQVTDLVKKIEDLRKTLDKLIDETMNVEGLTAQKIKDEPKRIQEEIDLLNGLLRYIDSHVERGSLFKKGVLVYPLNIDEMYNEIRKVYNGIQSRKVDEKAANYYLQVKGRIEQKSNEIIAEIGKLMAIIGKEVPPSSAQGDLQKEIKKEEKILRRHTNYFMLTWPALQNLLGIAESKLDLKKKLDAAQSVLKQLRRYENREQFRASVNKLKPVLERISASPSLNSNIREEIKRLVKRLEVFEAKWLTETAQVLGKELGKKPEEVNWNDVVTYIKVIEQDAQAETAAAGELKRLLDEILGETKKNISGRATGVGAGRFLEGAASAAGRGIGRARSGIEEAGLRAVMANEGIKNRVGGAIGRLQNPIPSLRNWASNVSNTAKRLRDKIRRKGDTTPEQEEAAGAEVSGPEVEERVNILLRVAQGIRDFNPEKSEKLRRLAEKLKWLKDGIVNQLKSLREARTPQEAEAILVKVQEEALQALAAAEEAETELQQLIMQNVRGTPTGIREDDLITMPDIIVRPQKAQRPTIPIDIKPGKAERTQRSKDTNLHGKSRGRRGFSSDPRQPPSRPPKSQPYDRTAAKKDARREIREEGY